MRDLDGGYLQYKQLRWHIMGLCIEQRHLLEDKHFRTP